MIKVTRNLSPGFPSVDMPSTALSMGAIKDDNDDNDDYDDNDDVSGEHRSMWSGMSR